MLCFIILLWIYGKSRQVANLLPSGIPAGHLLFSSCVNGKPVALRNRMHILMSKGVLMRVKNPHSFRKSHSLHTEEPSSSDTAAFSARHVYGLVGFDIAGK